MSIIQFYSQENDANNRFLQTYHDVQAYSRQILYDCQPITKYFNANLKNSSESRQPGGIPFSQPPSRIPPGPLSQGFGVSSLVSDHLLTNQPPPMSGMHFPPPVVAPAFIPGRKSM
jgi:hypothetical protein